MQKMCEPMTSQRFKQAKYYCTLVRKEKEINFENRIVNKEMSVILNIKFQCVFTEKST